MRIEYRRATSADIPAMSAIRLAVRENVLSDPRKVTLAMYEDYLDRLGRGWVAEVDGVVVGFAYGARADASIWALFVRPEHERKGIGKRLLALATEWLFAVGAERVVLSTEAATRADRFYAAQGWTRGAMKDDVEVTYTLERGAHAVRRLALVTLVVRDYDEAIAWFVEALGFELVEDRPLGVGKRWVVVAPRGGRGAALLLARASDDAQRARVGDQTGGRVGFFLETDDLRRDRARMLERGVRFEEEPRDEPYGTVAVFRDLCGNRWDLVQRRT